ncbi:winged helix-turn-helix domain-containing protein [Shewanella marina]|uniref:winged helix-turn-helix domain-containing protein n=1 Tax=Shewanella marina TaxID=487319 RepID=UPI0004729A6D|nr:helix-turn-helix domain-containing protein [Shewanella marina]
MQIGGCWFDIDRKELINQSKALTWYLAPQELALVEIMFAHQGRVVSIPHLIHSLQWHGVNEARLTVMMQKLARFIASDDGTLLELVSDQGYILHNRPMPRKLFDNPYRGISVRHYLLLVTLIFGMVIFVYSKLDNHASVLPKFERQVITENKQVIDFNVYGTEQQKQLLSNRLDGFLGLLQQCDTVNWDSISTSLSADTQMFNIVLKRDNEGEVELQNLKVFTRAQKPNFMSMRWLKEAGICA